MRISLNRPAAALLATLAAPALALPAFAQTAPAPTAPAQTAPAPTAPAQTAPAASTPAPGAPAASATPAPRRAHPRRHHLTAAERAARVEARITRLHNQLGITPAQQAKWDQFAGVMRDNAKNMEQSFRNRGAHLASMSAAQNMQSYADLAVAHAQDVQRLAVAFQSLYGDLSPAQKHTADMLFRHRGPGGRHRAPHASKP